MKHLKLFFALFAMLALGVGNVWGAETLYKTALFGANYNSKKVGSYTDTWTATNDGFVVTIVNANNNNNSWAYIKMGRKSDPSVGSITTQSAIDKPISKITMTIDAVTAKNINSIKLKTSTDGSSFVEVGNFTISKGEQSVTINNPTANLYYQIEVDCKTGSNGSIQISKVQYYATEDAGGSEETVVSVPTFSVPEGTFYSPINVELSCSTADAEIHYTLDGSTPSSTSEKYATAIAISETTTVKAIAVKDGLTNSEVATATYTKGEAVTSYDIDFETNALEAYVNWDFSNITITTATIKAKAGTYYANTSGKASASIKTKEKIQYPGILTFSVSKESNNTTASNWLVQVSENGTTWSTVGTISATEMTKETWKDHSVDLSDYENVYVQISYGGSTAVRAIDEISLAQSVAPVKYTLTIESPENGTLLVTNGGASVASGDQFKAGTSLVVTPTPASGYLFESLTVDGTLVELTEGSYTFTMPAADATIAATFKENVKPAATLTLSKNRVEETFPGEHKVGDVITLPDFTSDCSKTFVGWDSKSDCTDAPEYKAGESYTLAAETQILYAVYADGESGEVVTQTLTITDQTTNSTYGKNSFTDNKGGVWSGQSNIPDATHFGLRQNDDNTHMASPVFPNNITNITAKIRNQSQSERKVYLCSNNTTAKPSSGDLGGVKVNGSVTDIEHTFTLNGTFNQFYIYTNGALQFNEIEVTYSSAPTYSNYSTKCVAAPIATVDPTSVTATIAGGNGKVEVTYENVNTTNVSVALYNDAACTEAFTAGWLTASIDADKNIAYTVAENTTYAERKAYIQLTAPETTGATDPDVVVIPVTQAGKDKVFASLEALLAAITPTTEGVEVTVTLTNEVIQDFYTSGSYRNGIALNVPYQGVVKVIEIYCKDVPAEWVKGGKVSGTITCPWKLYNSTWELCPDAWTELTYTAPATVKSIAVSGTPTKTTYVDGEAFDPTGLVVTATLTDDSTEPIDVALVDWTFDPETLSKGETSVSVVATYNTMASAAYEVTGLTVNDIPTKTVAEFIAAGGTRCYLEGIVSNITNTTYGNFDLTDASGTIYVYGCLNAAGESKKFAELGVKNGDKIKVIADEYELYGGTKDEAKDVQYVSHISAASITVENITMEVDEVATITATVVPAEAEVTYTIKENAANAISLSGNTITALAEGTATITATVAEGATYLSNSVDFTVTVTPQNIATLPFAFDGGVSEIATTLGMSQKNLGTDYGSSPKLKFDDKDDYVIIHFDERPGILTYDIKANTGSGAFSGEFAVQESADGVTYRDLVKYTTISGSKEAKTHNCFDKDTRYIKFIFATKDNGNVALGNIKIETSVVTKVTPSVESGIFSVGDGKYVQFSTGNLQYEVGTNTWSFASEQYEVIGGEAYTGSNNTNYGMNVPGYTGKLDLFGWSCDGKYGVNPSNADADYTGEFADWGELVNETGWYTLTKDEMNYILNRKKDGKKLWALATVCGMNGLILLPDNWNTSTTLEYGYVPTDWNYEKNQFDDAAWAALEAAGAVFLPEGGSRVGGHGNKIGFDGKTVETDATKLDANGDYFHVDNVGSMGYYWLNTQDTRDDYQNCASFLILPGWSDNGTPNDESDDKAHAPQVWSREKRRGNSVRLVKAVEPAHKRTTTAGRYGTICLPGDIVLCDGATLYEVAGKEGNKVIFDEVTTPEAGMPYIFLAEKTEVLFFCGDQTAAAGNHNSLYGTFTVMQNSELEGMYMVQNNKIVECNPANSGVAENRAYFKGTELMALGKPGAQMPGRRRITMGTESENTATGTEDVVAPEGQTLKLIENGQLIIIRNGEKFNAQGVRF